MPRFMLLMHPNIDEAEYAEGPDAEAVEPMMKFNQQLADAGGLLALDGLAPPSEGARVEVKGGQVTVTDGPFAEAKEVVGGYWIIQARDRAEAVEWAKRVPLGEGPWVEVRKIFDDEDFSEEVRAVVAAHPVADPPEQTVER